MLYVLVFLSGVAGLVYEILWINQLGLLFGNTSHAAASTFAAFFGGLALGSWFLGRRSDTMKSPLKVFAGLQVGIAVTALLYFVILSIFYRIYPAVYQNVHSPALLLLVKFALALLLILPPAFFMGGTIPVMAQHVIRSRAAFGRTSALLYGVNTLGAALGAFLAGFHLPLWLGFRGTCVLAMAVTGVIAAVAWKLADPGSSSHRTPSKATDGHRRQSTADAFSPWTLALCFASGFGILALEVVWTRMFTQVLENSVYTFSSILVVVLICLALGAYASSLLSRLKVQPIFLLAVLTLLGGISVMVTPLVFMKLTDSMNIIVSRGTWLEYVTLIYKNVVFAIGPPALILGTIFPYLMKVEEQRVVSAGRSLGTLSAVNTAGAILGSLLCGFVFLESFGMWTTMWSLALLYLGVAAVLAVAGATRRSMATDGHRRPSKAVDSVRRPANVVVIVMALLMMATQVFLMDPRSLPVTSIDKLRQDQEILEVWEGSGCTVAVAEDMYGMSIKINSHYGLGSTGAMMQEKLQNDVPLMVYPETKSIFFLGMGTGITAGSSLNEQHSNVTRVVACELVADVVEAAEKYFTNIEGFDFTQGLFSDPRATVLVEDGRHYLMAADDSFDMINSDLFVPFRSGAGSLYSKEHFESVKKRLNHGGVFFQWLPLYQVTENELMIIGRTMLEVFDQVTLWRNNFQPGEEVVAFAGHLTKDPLHASPLDASDDRRISLEGKTSMDLTRLALPFDPDSILFFYCGNVTEAASLFDDYDINTDNRPLIEYMAPRTYRNMKDTSTPWFVGPRIARLVEAIQAECPPSTDPFLANRTDISRRLPTAGIHYHRARIWEVIGNDSERRKAWRRFRDKWVSEEGAQRPTTPGRLRGESPRAGDAQRPTPN